MQYRYSLALLPLLLWALLPTLLQAQEGWAWTESAGWARYEGSAKGTPQEQYSAARNHEKKGEYYDAARQYFLLVRTFPDSQEGKAGIIHLSNCLFKMENFYHSFKAIESCIERYPKSIHLQRLLAMEMRIGKRFMEGAPVRLYGKNRRRDSLKAGVEIFTAVHKHDKTGPYADAALLECGRALLELKRPKTAKDKFAILISTFRESDLIPLARYLTERANIMLGIGSVDRARQLLAVLKSSAVAQNSPDIIVPVAKTIEKDETSLLEQDAARLLKSGDFYAKQGKPKTFDAAVFTYKEVIRRYPDTTAARLAQMRISSLSQKGRPEKSFFDEQFDLPKIPKPAKKLLNPKKLWVRRSRKKEGPEVAQSSAILTAPQASLKSVDGTDLFPAGGNESYMAGDVVIDLRAEEAELDALLVPEGKPRGLRVPETKAPRPYPIASAPPRSAAPAPAPALPAQHGVRTPQPTPRQGQPSSTPHASQSKLPKPMLPVQHSRSAPTATPSVTVPATAPTPTAKQTVEEEDDFMILVPGSSAPPATRKDTAPRPAPRTPSSNPGPSAKPAATGSENGWSFGEDFED
jgi:TolA-binding protein